VGSATTGTPPRQQLQPTEVKVPRLLLLLLASQSAVILSLHIQGRHMLFFSIPAVKECSNRNHKEHNREARTG
jgi:hypothetical protein